MARTIRGIFAERVGGRPRLVLFLCVLAAANGTVAVVGYSGGDPRLIMALTASAAIILAALVPVAGERPVSIAAISLFTLFLPIGLAAGRNAAYGVTLFFIPVFIAFALEYFGRLPVLLCGVWSLVTLGFWFVRFRDPAYGSDAAITVCVSYLFYILGAVLVDGDLRFARMARDRLEAEARHRINNHAQIIAGLAALAYAIPDRASSGDERLGNWLDALESASASAEASARFCRVDLGAGVAVLQRHLNSRPGFRSGALTGSGSVSVDASVQLFLLISELASRLARQGSAWSLSVVADQTGTRVELSASGGVDSLPAPDGGPQGEDFVQELLEAFKARIDPGPAAWRSQLRLSESVAPAAGTDWSLPRRGLLHRIGSWLSGSVSRSGGISGTKDASFAIFLSILILVVGGFAISSLVGLGAFRPLTYAMLALLAVSACILRVLGARAAASLLVWTWANLGLVAPFFDSPGREYGAYLHMLTMLPLLAFGFIGRRAALALTASCLVAVVLWRLVVEDAVVGASGFATMLASLVAFAACIVSLSLDLGNSYHSKGSLANIVARRSAADIGIVKAAREGSGAGEREAPVERVRHAIMTLSRAYAAILDQPDLAAVDFPRALEDFRARKRENPRSVRESVPRSAVRRRTRASIDAWDAIDALFVAEYLESSLPGESAPPRCRAALVTGRLVATLAAGCAGETSASALKTIGARLEQRRATTRLHLPLRKLGKAARMLAGLGVPRLSDSAGA